MFPEGGYPVVSDAVRDGGEDVLPLVEGGDHEPVVPLHVPLLDLQPMY